MILTVTLNTSIDQALFLDSLKLGDTNRVQKVQIDAGGKGVNLSRVAHVFGGNTLATGFAGGPTGDFLRGLLDRAGVPHQFVPTAEPTRTNFNIETDDGHPPTTLNALGPHVSAQEWATFCSLFQEVLPQADWVCLCGSIPPGLDLTVYQELVAMCKGKRVLVDADGDALALAAKSCPTMLKPNLKEAERLLGQAIQDPVEAAQSLRELAGAEMVIISLGAQGAVLASSEGVYHGDSPQVIAVSTVGSGDSMLGAFLARLEGGDPVPTAFQWGLAAGAATATTDGTGIGPLSVIELLFDRARVKRVG